MVFGRLYSSSFKQKCLSVFPQSDQKIPVSVFFGGDGSVVLAELAGSAAGESGGE